MAMITCSECGNNVSDQANVCPHCGIRMQQQAVVIANPYHGKKNMLLGKLLAVIGPFLIMFSFFSGKSGLFLLGIVLIFLGAIILVIGRIQHWWHWR